MMLNARHRCQLGRTSAYYNDSGNLEIQLTHKNSSGNSPDGQSGTDSSSSNTLEDLSNKAQELGG